MEQKLVLKPIYKPEAVLKNWEYFLEGVEEVISQSNFRLSLTEILNEVLSGNYLFWVAFSGNIYCGFFITYLNKKVKEDRLINELLIVAGYKRKEFGDIFEDFDKQLEEYAKEAKCEMIYFYTWREEAFIRKYSELGWKEGQVMLYKEVS